MGKPRVIAELETDLSVPSRVLVDVERMGHASLEWECMACETTVEATFHARMVGETEDRAVYRIVMNCPSCRRSFPTTALFLVPPLPQRKKRGPRDVAEVANEVFRDTERRSFYQRQREALEYRADDE